MYICDRCETTCSEDELPKFTEDYGYDTGVGWMSCPQEFVEDCSCGGSWEEATECKGCGEYFLNEHYIDYCESCIDKEATFENAMIFGDEEDSKVTVEINGYLAHEYTAEQIETLMRRDLEQSKKHIALNHYEYVKNNLSEFADWLEKRDE